MSWEIGECVAYHEDSTRFYSLKGTDDYIAAVFFDYAVHEATFYRALDTNGKDIKKPGYIKEGFLSKGDGDIIIWD